MATASDILAALRTTLQAVSGWKEAQQLHEDHATAPEVDRSWAVGVQDTSDVERLRGARMRRTRVDISLARRIKTPGPQASVAAIISDSEPIRDLVEATTASGVSGIRVTNTRRQLSADRSHHVIILETDIRHTEA